ncbi:uncharacterized protein [Ptychodera flava]|uniref:uncharacterized protein n=1 Tax=Ptychodera flava TaxID=63121 RepID=UPI003969EBE0
MRSTIQDEMTLFPMSTKIILLPGFLCQIVKVHTQQCIGTGCDDSNQEEVETTSWQIPVICATAAAIAIVAALVVAVAVFLCKRRQKSVEPATHEKPTELSSSYGTFNSDETEEGDSQKPDSTQTSTGEPEDSANIGQSELASDLTVTLEDETVARAIADAGNGRGRSEQRPFVRGRVDSDQKQSDKNKMHRGEGPNMEDVKAAPKLHPRPLIHQRRSRWQAAAAVERPPGTKAVYMPPSIDRQYGVTVFLAKTPEEMETERVAISKTDRAQQAAVRSETDRVRQAAARFEADIERQAASAAATAAPSKGVPTIAPQEARERFQRPRLRKPTTEPVKKETKEEDWKKDGKGRKRYEDKFVQTDSSDNEEE